MSYTIHCICSLNSRGVCRNCSRIKMVVLLKNGWDQFKISTPTGKKVNPVYYNFYKHNRKPPEEIIKKMVERFLKNGAEKIATRKLHFYENNQLIADYTL